MTRTTDGGTLPANLNPNPRFFQGGTAGDVSTFVPKSQTPFQWVSCDTVEQIEAAVAYRLPYGRRKQVINDVLELLDLGHKRDDFVNGLSRGMKQRLCLAKTLVHDPPVLILDEPTAGLDPAQIREVRELVRGYQEAGEHQISMAADGLPAGKNVADWTLTDFTPEFNRQLENYLRGYKKHYQDIYNQAVFAREKLIARKEEERGSDYNVTLIKNRYYNESLADLLTNVSEKNRIIEYNGQLVQQLDNVFLDPEPGHTLDYRAHFFAPRKNFMGYLIDTYGFNLLVIWFMTLVLYGALYFEWLRKLANAGGFIRIPRPGRNSI